MNIVENDLPIGTIVKLKYPPNTPIRWRITSELINGHYELTLIPDSLPINSVVEPGILQKTLARPNEIIVVPHGGRRRRGRRHTKHRNMKRRRSLRSR